MGADGLDSALGNPEGCLEEAARARQFFHTLGGPGLTAAFPTPALLQPLPEMEYNGNPESVGYKIKYSRADGHGKTLSHVVQDRVEREYTIEDLEEWTEYRVQVQAFNAIGSGPWSQTVMGRTRESGTAPSCQLPHPLHLPGAWGYPPTFVSLPSGPSKGSKAGAVVRKCPGLLFLFVLSVPQSILCVCVAAPSRA